MWRTWRNVHKDVWGGSLQAVEPPNVQGQESVCVQGRVRRQVWLKEQEAEMRSKDGPDPVGLQDVRRGWFYLSRIWSYRIIWTEEDLLWLLSRSICQAAVQSQEVKGEGGAEDPEGNSAGSRVGMLLLVWGVSREDEWVDSWSIPKMRFTAFPSGFNLSYEKEWKRIAKFEICN